MPIKRNLSNLPSAQTTGIPPSRTPTVLAPVITHFENDWLNREEKPHALEGRAFRLSDISKRCDRALVYSMAHVPKSNPPDVASHWRFWLGQTVHDKFDQAMAEVMTEADGWQFEVDIDLRPLGIDGSAHADAVQFVDGKARIVAELKSVGGYAFKLHATYFDGPPKGPKYEHIAQGALAAAALGAPYLAICYLSLECMSPQIASRYSDSPAGRFLAEWKYQMTDLQGLVDHEVSRTRRLIRTYEAGEIPTRTLDTDETPPGAFVGNPKAQPGSGSWLLVDPATGDIRQTGTTWMCAYCDYRELCTEQGPEPSTIAVAIELAASLD